uniref:Uncharacterized protein n=1 Tax=Cacopsylla melanoneura TaxID=428564 RepID=A0A8D8M0T2_9HEMI
MDSQNTPKLHSKYSFNGHPKYLITTFEVYLRLMDTQNTPKLHSKYSFNGHPPYSANNLAEGHSQNLTSPKKPILMSRNPKLRAIKNKLRLIKHKLRFQNP